MAEPWTEGACAVKDGAVGLPAGFLPPAVAAAVGGPIVGFSEDWAVPKIYRALLDEDRPHTLERHRWVRVPGEPAALLAGLRDALVAGGMEARWSGPQRSAVVWRVEGKVRLLATKTRIADHIAVSLHDEYAVEALRPHQKAWEEAGAALLPAELLAGRTSWAHRLRRSCVRGQWRVEVAWTLPPAAWASFLGDAKRRSFRPMEGLDDEIWLRRGDLRADGLGILAAGGAPAMDVSLYRGPSFAMLGREIDAVDRSLATP